MYSKSDMGKSQRLAEYLKSMIFSGAYPPGSRIPSIMELCQQYDFSYGAVQRGVESLQKEGLLKTRRNHFELCEVLKSGKI